MVTVGSLYSGAGFLDTALEQAGFTIKWANEMDKHACRTYRLNHSNNLIEGDVYDIDITKLDKVDMLVAGFPCQPFSIAGKKKGFEDPRGNHFHRILEFLNILKPSVVFLENVRNFKSHDKGATYTTATGLLTKCGYHFKDAILNTSEYSEIPQNRERFFLVGFRDKKLCDAFEFPKVYPETRNFKSLLIKEVHKDFYYDENSKIYAKLKEAVTDPTTFYQYRRTYVRENKSNECPTLTANMGTGGHNVPILLTELGIRKLTPLECFAFQGYNDVKFPEKMANCHLYKQAGNGVTIPVVKRIAQNIRKVLEENSEQSDTELGLLPEATREILSRWKEQSKEVLPVLES